MRSPKAVLLVLLIGLAVLDVAVAVRRSTVPLALDGVVRQVEVRREKHPGVDDVYVVDVGSRRDLVVDREMAEALGEGDVVSKDAWSREMRVGDRVVRLGWSRDAVRLALAAPLLVLLGVVLLRR